MHTFLRSSNCEVTLCYPVEGKEAKLHLSHVRRDDGRQYVAEVWRQTSISLWPHDEISLCEEQDPKYDSVCF
jgi:hypothetical protein